jgi:hypothetical protein
MPLQQGTIGVKSYPVQIPFVNVELHTCFLVFYTNKLTHHEWRLGIGSTLVTSDCFLGRRASIAECFICVSKLGDIWIEAIQPFTLCVNIVLVVCESVPMHASKNYSCLAHGNSTHSLVCACGYHSLFWSVFPLKRGQIVCLFVCLGCMYSCPFALALYLFIFFLYFTVSFSNNILIQ